MTLCPKCDGDLVPFAHTGGATLRRCRTCGRLEIRPHQEARGEITCAGIYPPVRVWVDEAAGEIAEAK